MKRTSLLSLVSLSMLAAAAACAQHAPADDGQHGAASGATPTTAAANGTVVAAAAAPAPADTADKDCLDAFQLPAEKFTDPARNFDEAKKALLEEYYDPSLTEEDLYRAAVAGMLERVDPGMHKWNKLLSPTQYAELHRDLEGEVIGVGVKIKFDSTSGYIDVIGTMPGSPADRAGLAPPDKIVTVNGRLYKGLTEMDCVNDIRGKAGETVTLSVLRGDKLVSVPLKREKIGYDLVSDMVLGGDVGYVRIPSFNSKTAAALKDALGDLRGKSVHGLVLDLRCNPGGSFDAAVASASELVPAQATIATLKKRTGTEAVQSKDAPVMTGVPLAVLIDRDTSSGAELMAAALQENAHAVLIGQRTLGKWTVQTISDLPNGYAVKFTLALFQSPSGRSFQSVGMPPDVEVDMAEESIERLESVSDTTKRLADDVQLRTAVQMLQRGH
jgi:carboxyl-terminal processing protease